MNLMPEHSYSSLLSATSLQDTQEDGNVSGFLSDFKLKLKTVSALEAEQVLVLVLVAVLVVNLV